MRRWSLRLPGSAGKDREAPFTAHPMQRHMAPLHRPFRAIRTLERSEHPSCVCGGRCWWVLRRLPDMRPRCSIVYQAARSAHSRCALCTNYQCSTLAAHTLALLSSVWRPSAARSAWLWSMVIRDIGHKRNSDVSVSTMYHQHVAAVHDVEHRDV